MRDFPQEPTRLIGAVRSLRMLNKRLAEQRAVLWSLQMSAGAEADANAHKTIE